jgi:hypothetical protein
MQAIAPVIAALEASGKVEISTYATSESMPVIAEFGVHARLLDDVLFANRPAACLSSIFDAHRPELLLSGSSPARGAAPETPEHFAILEARRRGLRSLAILDYWGMYEERFSRDGHSISPDLLPDRLCVLDQRASAELAAIGVPANRIAVTHNPWLDRLVARTTAAAVVQPGKSARKITVLLASQPLAETRVARRWLYDQFDLFECLLDAMPVQTTPELHATLQVLPHPSEDIARWKALLASAVRSDVKVELRVDRVIDLLQDADYLVTSHSTLAYEALYFGTPCISLHPGVENVKRFWMEDIGLSRFFHDGVALRQYLLASDPAGERQRVLTRKRELLASSQFFSDGRATERVLQEVNYLLDSSRRSYAQ